VVVRRHHVRHRQIVALALSVSAAVLLGLGFYFGRRSAYGELGVDPARYAELQRALPEAREQIAELERQATAARTRHEVDRSALELVRQELARQEEQIADLGEGLRFYRSLMAPGEIAEGVSFQGIEVVPGDGPGRYAYRLVAQQEARKHDSVRGTLQINVLGRSDGEAISYTLAELAGDLEGDSIPLRFRYFQAIEGELVIPEGFEPQVIEVLATVTSPRKLELREQYPWRLKEKFTHVGT
jgi:hypothetical protein